MVESNPPRSLFNGNDVSAVADAIGNGPVLVTPSQAWLLTGAAFSLGILGDVLFNGAAFGLNAALWLLAMLCVFHFASCRLKTRSNADRSGLMVAAFAMSLMLIWRDSPTLRLLNLTCICGLILLVVANPAGAELRRIGPLAILVPMYAGFVSLASSWWRLGSMLPWHVAPVYRLQAVTVGRALLLSTPIFLTFGGLFFAADAVFAQEVRRTLRFDLHAVQAHVMYTVGVTWLAAAILWSGLAVPAPPELAAELPESRRIKATETGILLGPLALLFGLFVVVQVRYLFGGQDAVQRSTSLTYAQYARHGFFELVVVSLLLLPVLTAINWARRRDRQSSVAFGGLAILLVGLLFVVMASAWQRLSIYMDAFGLTELRFYSAAVLPWLAVVFVWFLLSFALRINDRFSAGAVVAAIVLLVALNLVSPDAVITRTNLGRLNSGHGFDAEYTLSLSADAVPSIVHHIDRVEESQRCLVAEGLNDRWAKRRDDLRGWNRARWQHREVLQQEPRLLRACLSALYEPHRFDRAALWRQDRDAHL